MSDVFDQDTTIPPVAPVAAPVFDDKLKTIVNDKGEPKYKTVDDALEALKASQAHIKQLEAENSVRDAELLRLREEEAKAKTLEEIVAKLQNTTDPARNTTPPNAGLSEDAIAKAIDARLTAREQTARTQQNVTEVTNILTTKFGDKTKEVVAAKAAELGMSPKELGTLSSVNPKLVLSLFGEKPAVSQPTTPSVTTPLAPANTEKALEPQKGLIVGINATDKNRQALMKEIKERVYKRLEVTAT
jgi:methylphosphotriester-DNA--protein-cysteine methyltransferase